VNDRVRTAIDVILPGGEASPQRKIAVRLLVALVLITFVAVITYAGRDGYTDPEDDSISVLDAFYYSTVSITTTGYGDVRPVTDEARFVTTVLVTPARILFLVLLVGTTLEILAERSRQAFRVARWRRHLRDHTIICGYGTKGRSALRTLVGKGLPKERIVAIDPTEAAQAHAQGDGIAVIAGDAASQEALREAGIADARSVIVAVERDDTAILVTLTARELNPSATIVAAAREEENVHLLHQGGADGVITSSSAAGRLLGLSSETPQVTEVLEDILTLGKGLDIVEREVAPGEEVIHTHHTHQTALLAIVRGDELIRFGDPRASEIRPGDKVVELRNAVVEEDAATAAGGDGGR
jgi:voltage-gated potassium channel